MLVIGFSYHIVVIGFCILYTQCISQSTLFNIFEVVV